MHTLTDSIEEFFNRTEKLTATGNLADASHSLQQLLFNQALINARAYNDSGVISFRQGNKEKSLEFYKKAVDLAPKEPIYRKNLADLYYFAFGNTETALAHYRQILVDNPRDFDASLAIGRICADLSKYFLSEAEDFFNIAEKIKPNDIFLAEERKKLTPYHLREINDNTNHTEINESSEHNNNNPEGLYNTLSHTFQPGKELEAEKMLLNFTETYSEFALAFNDLGVISHQLEKLDQAGQSYRKAVELDPENITFLKNLADFLFVIEEKPQEAMPLYHEILKDNPKDLETLMMIGNICLSLGSPEEARTFYNLVLDIEPWHQDASNTLEMLDKKEFKRSSDYDEN